MVPLAAPAGLSALGEYIFYVDLAAVALFAFTGALVASRKQMDIFGFVLLGTAAGIGGGTLRDVLLGQLPVFWVKQPVYLAVCIAAASVTFFTAHLPQSRYRVLLWLDALGLALYCALGAEKALAVGAGPLVAVTMGVVTAAFGGIIRDILGGEVPLVLSKEVYVTAALAGACVFVAAHAAGLPAVAGWIAGAGTGFTVRALALTFHWSLPTYKARPGRTPDEVRKLDA